MGLPPRPEPGLRLPGSPLHCRLPWTTGAKLSLAAPGHLFSHLARSSPSSPETGDRARQSPSETQSPEPAHAHGWQERRPTFTEAAGHQRQASIQGSGCLNREAQRGSPPTQLKSIRKEAASGLRVLASWRGAPGLRGREEGHGMGAEELCPHSQGRARLCSQKRIRPLTCLRLLFPGGVPHLHCRHLGTSLTLPEDSLPVLVGPWLALFKAAQIQTPSALSGYERLQRRWG